MSLAEAGGIVAARTIGSCLEHWAREQPGKRFVKCGGPWMTYAEAEQRTAEIAAGLQSLGVGKGDRVALISANRIEVILSLIALARMGAVSVPLNTYLKGEFLRFQLNDSAASTVIVDTEGLDAVVSALDELPELRHVVTFESLTAGRLPGTVSARSLASIARDSAAFQKIDINETDPAAIIYTSGTTGMPKGCVLGQGYLLSGSSGAIRCGWVRQTDIMLSVFPLFHATGFSSALIGTIVTGSSCVVEPSFSARTLMHSVFEAEATVVFAIGAAGMAILATPPGEFDRKHMLRLAILPAMPAEGQRQWEARFGVDVVSGAYGQTEFMGISILDAREAKNKRESVGRPAPNIHIQLVDEHDHPVPVGEVGEIAVRPLEPEMMFQGYWSRADATLSVQRNLWHHTGDFGRLDEDGFLYFVDRKKDAMRRKGENVSSVELERSIRSHPKIAAVATHAVPSQMGEDEIKACIVLAEGCTMEPAELFQFFAKTLPYFAVPRYVEFMKALPLNANGRVMKPLLRERGIGDALDFEALGLVIARGERRK